MKQINYVFPKKGLKALDNAQEPMINSPKDVKIKVEYAAICGSDLHIVNGAFDYILEGYGFKPGTDVPLGHELSGVVIETGSAVTSCKVGDKVAINAVIPCGKCHFCRNGLEHMCNNPITGVGGIQEYIVMPEEGVYTLPEGITTRQGCLAEPTHVALGSINKAQIKPGQSVAIIGCGPIGMLVLQLAKLQGAYPIVAFDIIDEKIEKAKELGADFALNSKNLNVLTKAVEITNNLGFDRVIECSGSHHVLDMCISLLTKAGKLVITSAYSNGAKYELDLGTIYVKEISIETSNTAYDAFERATKLLNRIDIDKTITAEYSIDQFEEAFEAHRSGKNVKVVIKVTE